MLVRFSILLVVGVVHCTDDQIFETKTVGVGENVTLTCRFQKSFIQTTLFWIRLASGNMPEFLGGTFSFAYQEHFNETPHITAKQKNGSFILDIAETNSSDTGLYYCIVVYQLQMTFLKGILLKVKGPEPHVTSVIQVSPSDQVHAGDPVTFQCSVLFGPKQKRCAGEDRVYWYRAGSDQSHPSVVYPGVKNDGNCETSNKTQNCIYSFSKTIRSSDTGTYYCAVATCGQIFFGTRTKLEPEADRMLDQTTTFLYLLIAALTISLIVIAFLIYDIMKKRVHFCNVAVSQQTQPAATNSDRRTQRNEESLVYSAPAFNKRKGCKAAQKDKTSAEGNVVYSGIRELGQINH